MKVYAPIACVEAPDEGRDVKIYQAACSLLIHLTVVSFDDLKDANSRDRLIGRLIPKADKTVHVDFEKLISCTNYHY